jgi:hypothetical protein
VDESNKSFVHTSSDDDDESQIESPITELNETIHKRELQIESSVAVTQSSDDEEEQALHNMGKSSKSKSRKLKSKKKSSSSEKHGKKRGRKSSSKQSPIDGHLFATSSVFSNSDYESNASSSHALEPSRKKKRVSVSLKSSTENKAVSSPTHPSKSSEDSMSDSDDEISKIKTLQKLTAKPSSSTVEVQAQKKLHANDVYSDSDSSVESGPVRSQKPCLPVTFGKGKTEKKLGKQKSMKKSLFESSDSSDAEKPIEPVGHHEVKVEKIRDSSLPKSKEKESKSNRKKHRFHLSAGSSGSKEKSNKSSKKPKSERDMASDAMPSKRESGSTMEDYLFGSMTPSSGSEDEDGVSKLDVEPTKLPTVSVLTECTKPSDEVISVISRNVKSSPIEIPERKKSLSPSSSQEVGSEYLESHRSSISSSTSEKKRKKHHHKDKKSKRQDAESEQSSRSSKYSHSDVKEKPDFDSLFNSPKHSSIDNNCQVIAPSPAELFGSDDHQPFSLSATCKSLFGSSSDLTTKESKTIGLTVKDSSDTAAEAVQSIPGMFSSDEDDDDDNKLKIEIKQVIMASDESGLDCSDGPPEEKVESSCITENSTLEEEEKKLHSLFEQDKAIESIVQLEKSPSGSLLGVLREDEIIKDEIPKECPTTISQEETEDAVAAILNFDGQDEELAASPVKPTTVTPAIPPTPTVLSPPTISIPDETPVPVVTPVVEAVESSTTLTPDATTTTATVAVTTAIAVTAAVTTTVTAAVATTVTAATVTTVTAATVTVAVTATDAAKVISANVQDCIERVATSQDREISPEQSSAKVPELQVPSPKSSPVVAPSVDVIPSKTPDIQLRKSSVDSNASAGKEERLEEPNKIPSRRTSEQPKSRRASAEVDNGSADVYDFHDSDDENSSKKTQLSHPRHTPPIRVLTTKSPMTSPPLPAAPAPPIMSPPIEATKRLLSPCPSPTPVLVVQTTTSVSLPLPTPTPPSEEAPVKAPELVQPVVTPIPLPKVDVVEANLPPPIKTSVALPAPTQSAGRVKTPPSSASATVRNTIDETIDNVIRWALLNEPEPDTPTALTITPVVKAARCRSRSRSKDSPIESDSTMSITKVINRSGECSPRMGTPQSVITSHSPQVEIQRPSIFVGGPKTDKDGGHGEKHGENHEGGNALETLIDPKTGILMPMRRQSEEGQYVPIVGQNQDLPVLPKVQQPHFTIPSFSAKAEDPSGMKPSNPEVLRPVERIPFAHLQPHVQTQSLASPISKNEGLAAIFSQQHLFVQQHPVSPHQFGVSQNVAISKAQSMQQQQQPLIITSSASSPVSLIQNQTVSQPIVSGLPPHSVPSGVVFTSQGQFIQQKAHPGNLTSQAAMGKHFTSTVGVPGLPVSSPTQLIPVSASSCGPRAPFSSAQAQAVASQHGYQYAVISRPEVRPAFRQVTLPVSTGVNVQPHPNVIRGMSQQHLNPPTAHSQSEINSFQIPKATTITKVSTGEDESPPRKPVAMLTHSGVILPSNHGPSGPANGPKPPTGAMTHQQILQHQAQQDLFRRSAEGLIHVNKNEVAANAGLNKVCRIEKDPFLLYLSHYFNAYSWSTLYTLFRNNIWAQLSHLELISQEVLLRPQRPLLLPARN